MNPGISDLRTAFTGEQFTVMIVANKFQTGFDQPLLCAMYVDRKLSGVTAVQTLSRLNRTYRTPSGIAKTAAMTQVVDFVNAPESIRDAFEQIASAEVLDLREVTDPPIHMSDELGHQILKLQRGHRPIDFHVHLAGLHIRRDGHTQGVEIERDDRVQTLKVFSVDRMKTLKRAAGGS